MEYDCRQTEKLIDKMQQIRSKNNVNWMDLVRLAFELDPDRARDIISQIVENDRRIANILEELALGEPRD